MTTIADSMKHSRRRNLPFKKNMTVVVACMAALSMLCMTPTSLAFAPQSSLSAALSYSSSTALAVSSTTPTPTISDLPAVEFVDPQTGCNVVLLGCFHGTESSSQDVLQAVTPDTDVVVLELCETRFEDMKEGMKEEEEEALAAAAAAAQNNVNDASSSSSSKAQRKPWIVAYLMMIQKTVEQKGIGTGLAAAVLGGFSGMQTALSGFSPGLEFRTALECARQYDCEIVLADREVDETLKEVGRLPQISLGMLTNIWNNNHDNDNNILEEYKLHSTTLRQAVFGPEGPVRKRFSPVQLGQVLTRSGAAVQDLVRLTTPPTFLYYCFLQMILAGSPDLMASANDQYYAASAGASLNPSMMENIPHWIASAGILSMGYLGLALPAVRVILTERDVCLAEGVQEACRRAGKNGRVVAVLGLLHVNGVATRMMKAEVAAVTKEEEEVLL